jgi:hypothetical protein
MTLTDELRAAATADCLDDDQRTRILAEIADPDWGCLLATVYLDADWGDFIPDVIADRWENLSDDVKLMLFIVAREAAARSPGPYDYE